MLWWCSVCRCFVDWLKLSPCSVEIRELCFVNCLCWRTGPAVFSSEMGTGETLHDTQRMPVLLHTALLPLVHLNKAINNATVAMVIKESWKKPALFQPWERSFRQRGCLLVNTCVCVCVCVCVGKAGDSSRCWESGTMELSSHIRAETPTYRTALLPWPQQHQQHSETYFPHSS